MRRENIVSSLVVTRHSVSLLFTLSLHAVLDAHPSTRGFELTQTMSLFLGS